MPILSQSRDLTPKADSGAMAVALALCLYPGSGRLLPLVVDRVGDKLSAADPCHRTAGRHSPPVLATPGRPNV